MEFLAEPAVKCKQFAYVFSEEGREHIQATASQDEVAELALVAEQMRRVGYSNVKAWRQKFRTSDHIEPSLVFKLIGVLDALDLPYCESPESSSGAR
jgi:hypothetical protein